MNTSTPPLSPSKHRALGTSIEQEKEDSAPLARIR
jgi:hypothetical protein